MSSSLSDIGNRISALRKERGLTQDELSKNLHISRENLAKWETGERDIKTGNILLLAEYFKVSCDVLLKDFKPENIDVNYRTGLTDKAVDMLSDNFKSQPINLEILNYLIESGRLEELCNTILTYSLHEYNHQKRKALVENHRELNRQSVNVQTMSNTESLGATNDIMSIEYGEYRKFQTFQLSNELQKIAKETTDYMVNEFYPKLIAKEREKDG